MSKAVVIDVKAIGRAVVRMGKRQVNRVRQLFEATEPFLTDSWGAPGTWGLLPAEIIPDEYPALLPDARANQKPEQVKVPLEPEVVQEPDMTVDELLNILTQHGLDGGEVKKLPSGAMRITVDDFQREYVRV
jgi:hypothetical protein